MAQNHPAGAAHAHPAAASMVEEQEVESVRRLLSFLEKTFKTARAYGPTHHLAQQFMQQLYETLAAHLAVRGALSLVVQRFEFYYRGEMVYRKAAQDENLAFKLYGAGIRELSFSRGLSQGTLSSFLETLGAAYDMATSDDDVITRLWEKNLSDVSIVTAEEIVKNEEAARALIPQDSGTLNTPTSRLSAITQAESARLAGEGRAGGPATDASNHSRDSSVQAVSATETAQQAKEAAGDEGEGAVYSPLDLPAFEVSPDELEQLALQIKAESHQDTPAYLLDMLKVIVASEKSAEVLSELRGLLRGIFENLIEEGNWKRLSSIVDKLREVHRQRDLAEEQKKMVSDMLDALHGPKQMAALESRLNADLNAGTDDLLVFFLHLAPHAVPALCRLLGNLKFEEHRMALCDVLAALAKDKPEPLIKGLTDPRWYYVRNLLVVIGKLRNPSLAQAVQPLAAHPDARVRREALKTLGMLGGTGTGNPIVGVLIDPDEGIRSSALTLLRTGKYATPFSAWAPVITHKEFMHRPLSELRTTFEVMTRLVGAECVPYCQHLLTQRLWINRKTKQYLGALAAEALGQIGTPEAISALEAGKKRYNRVIRNASVAAIATLKRRNH
ncbi:MAG: HEAT repeat domain-containing protein [Nitrospiraceae bacterium]